MLSTRKTATALLAIAIIFLATGCGGARSRYLSHMHRGQEYFNKGDFAKAGVEFRNAMQIQPRDPKARIMAGQSAEQQGKVRDALGLYQSVIDSTPDDIDARADLARLFAFSGQPDAALKLLEPALAKHPDNAVLLTVRAVARLQRKDVAGATADADRALQLAPSNEQAIALRAGLYRQAGNIERALSVVREGVRLVPGSANLRTVLADLALIADQPAEAEAQLRAIVASDPKNLQYRSRLAVFYSRTHKFDDARKVLEEAVTIAPGSDEAKLNLANFVASEGKPERAEQILRGFIAHSPDNSALRLGLAALILHSGKPADAAKEYEEVVRRDPTGPAGVSARDSLANIAVTQGRYTEVRRLVAEVLQINSRDNDALALRARMSLLQGDSSAAIVDLRSILRDQPTAVGVHRMLAHAYLAAGQPSLAEQAFRETLDLSPADTSLQIELAQLLVQTQHADQAVALLEVAVRKAPSEAPLREALAHAYLAKGDFAAAHSTADDLRTLHPDAPLGYFLAGLAAEGQNRLDDAQSSFEHALAVQPEGLDSLSALAKLEMRRGHADQAIALVKGAIARIPEGPAKPTALAPVSAAGGGAPFSVNAFRFNLLGELYLTQKNIPLAEEALTQATALATAWSLPYRNLALARYAAKDVPGAIAAYELALKIAPTDPQLVAELAQIYTKQGRVDEAIARYDALYRRDPSSSVVANNLAMLLVTYKKDRASLDRARDLTATFASSNNGVLLDTNGWVHFKRAEYSQALPVLERALDRAPDSSEIHYHLGMAEMASGQTDRARKNLEAALAGSGTFSGAEEARSALASLKERPG